MAKTSEATPEVVQKTAGLDAMIYLHFLKVMLIVFMVLSAVGVCLLLPLNIFAQKKSWVILDSFMVTTSNGFLDPSQSLLLHTMVALFIGLSMVVVVYMLRDFLITNARNEADNKNAIPPVQAYTVEVQGLRIDPPVQPEELTPLADAVAGQDKVLAIAVALDVTDIVDNVEKTRVLKKKLGRYRQQLENDKERPTIQTGLLRYIGCGNSQDAISYTEKEIAELEKEVEKERAVANRPGTGTAFITFKKREAAVRFIDKFKDPLKSRRECQMPTIGANKDCLCENQNRWSVELAVKPEDIFWRNLRYSTFHRVLLTVAGFFLLVILLAFIVTPIFFVQIFLTLGDLTVEEFDKVKNVAQGHGSYHDYFSMAEDERQFNHFAILVLQFLWPLLILCINYFIMPALVHYCAKFFGQRYVSAMQRTSYNLIFFFMLMNILIFPALALSGIDEFMEVSRQVPLDRMLAQIVLYGSNRPFFVDYIAQAGLLASAFYFVFHTTTPMINDWAGHDSSELVWEFDFAYFYSSFLSVLAIGLMFAVTVPLVLPCVLLFLIMRYYTDKWQLLTAHSTERVDPAPETTASAVLVSMLIITAVAQAAFASWLALQGAWNLAVWPWVLTMCLGFYIAFPWTRHRFITVSNKWRATREEHPATWEVEAIPAYKAAYENPYLAAAGEDRTSRLRGDVTPGIWDGV